MQTRTMLWAALLIAALFSSACSQNTSKMQNGYYTAEVASFDEHGWKEYVTIYVNNDKIITVEYNAKNSSGFVKSWDMDYMRKMNAQDGTYPNKYTRAYADALMNRQNPDKVDVITGATHSHPVFQLLAEAAIAQAKAGNKKVAFVPLSAVEGKKVKD